MVDQQNVLEVGAERGAGRGRLVGAVVAAQQRGRAVREGVELEVVVSPDKLVETVERLLERHRPVDAAQPEGRHGLDA